MPTGPLRTARYAKAWLRGGVEVEEDELTLDRAGTPVPATFVRPPGADSDVPAWVVLHGITRQGRAHGQLVRFTHAMAAAGLASIVPEVPEWRELALAPGLTVPTVRAAIDGLRSTGRVREGPVGVLGFSFGAPHAIAASADPLQRGDIAGASGFGGYSELESTFRFLMTGDHEWGGRSRRLRVDPYGRWIVAANYLTGVPEYSEATAVADALRRLARHAGDVGQASWDPVYDPMVVALRADLPEEWRSLYDQFAWPSTQSAPEVDARGWADRLAEAGRRVDSALDPLPRLAEVRGPVHVLHGRNDHLIPFTESLRMKRALAGADTWCTVTRLFGHSAQDAFPMLRAAREVPRFARAISRVMTVV